MSGSDFIWHLPVCGFCWVHGSSLHCVQSLCRPLWACCLGWMRGHKWRRLHQLLQPQLQTSTLWVQRPLSFMKSLFPCLYIPDLKWSRSKGSTLDFLLRFILLPRLTAAWWPLLGCETPNAATHDSWIPARRWVGGTKNALRLGTLQPSCEFVTFHANGWNNYHQKTGFLDTSFS